MAKKKASRPKKATSKHAARKRNTPRQRASGGTTQAARLSRRRASVEEEATRAGQSGSDQQIPDQPLADSESVEELLDEGQSFEAGIVSGVEREPATGGGEVITKEVPEDDVPEEYLRNRENE